MATLRPHGDVMTRSFPKSAQLSAHLAVILALLGASTTAAAPHRVPGGAANAEPGQAAATSDTRARQQPQQEPTDSTAALLARGGAFTASVEMVRVPVIVVDGDGSFVQNLASDDFAVRDGRRDHSVDHFVSDAEPVIVGVLLDASATMAMWSNDAGVAVENIARTLRPEDELFLISYGTEVAMLQEPTRDKDALLRALEGYGSQDAADRALYDAIAQGLGTLRGSPIEKRSLIVIGSGGDTASELGELSLRQLISVAGVTIHTIAMTPPSASAAATGRQLGRLRTLPEIAGFTAGFVARRPRAAAARVSSTRWSAAAGADISSYLKHQYLLHYAPQDPPRPGTWRSIRVNVSGEHREIRARSGYTR